MPLRVFFQFKINVYEFIKSINPSIRTKDEQINPTRADQQC